MEKVTIASVDGENIKVKWLALMEAELRSDTVTLLKSAPAATPISPPPEFTIQIIPTQS
jgi:hypothetical protein